MQIRYLLAIATVFAAGAVFAQAYKWVDEDGVVHYSDRPEPGAEELELPRQPRIGTAIAPRGGAARAQESEEPADVEPFQYQVLEVASPAPEETLWNIEGILNVSLNLQPGLQPGHRIRVYFDGQPRFVSGTSFQVDQVFRGTHNLQAEVIDQNGELMIRSQPGRFYVQQNRVTGPPPPR